MEDTIDNKEEKKKIQSLDSINKKITVEILNELSAAYSEDSYSFKNVDDIVSAVQDELSQMDSDELNEIKNNLKIKLREIIEKYVQIREKTLSERLEYKESRLDREWKENVRKMKENERK